jgi:hypothetical protein
LTQIVTNRKIIEKEFDSAISNHIRVYEKSNMELVLLEFILGGRSPYVVIENRLDELGVWYGGIIFTRGMRRIEFGGSKILGL